MNLNWAKRAAVFQLPNLRQALAVVRHNMKSLFLIYLLLFTASCDRPSSVIRPSIDTSAVSEDFNYIKGLSCQLSLYPLYNGVDNFEFRFWVMDILYDDRLIIIKKDSLGSSSKEYIFKRDSVSGQTVTVSTDMNNYPNTIDTAFMRFIKPKIAINKFIDSIATYDLIHIPTQKRIPGFQQIVAGKYYIFEVATKGEYKMLRYDYPELKEDLYNKKVTKLVEFLQRQLGPFSFEL